MSESKPARRRAATARTIRWLLVPLIALVGAACVDEVTGEDERDTNETGVPDDFGPDGEMAVDEGEPEPDPDDGVPIDMAVDVAVDAEVDADLRKCMPGDDGGPCAVGQGICRREGRKICEDEKFVCNVQPGPPADELCNEVDDDCDGRADEGVAPEPCFTGDPALMGVGSCRTGMRACGSDVCEGEVLPVAEFCNDIDDDCDGTIDEEAPLEPCYRGPEGTEDVGICRGGQQRCPTGPDGAGECVGQVLPEAQETCDGRDEDCDGRVDVAAGADTGACGELVADRCRMWFGWTDHDFIDPGENMERAFDEWPGCGDVDESLDGRGRCTTTAFDRAIHVLPMPVGEVLGNRNKLAVRWLCPIEDPGDEDADLLNRIAGECMVTLGERYTPGEVDLDAWPPCDADGMTLWGVGDRYRCTTTHPRGRWRAVRFGRLFGNETALALALRCLSDEPVLRAVETQSEVWLGWAPRLAGVPPESPPDWQTCAGAQPDDREAVRCTSTGGDGRFHAISIHIVTPEGEFDDPGRFGVALRPVPLPPAEGR